MTNDSKEALILIDIQNDYFAHGTMALQGSLEASICAAKILNEFRAHKNTVIHVQHIATRPSATFFLPDTRGAEIHENVKPLADEKVIVKHYPNSFIGTELYELLTQEKIEKVVICGMMTHMCVDATVRAAKDYGFNVAVISDACATKDLNFNQKTVKAAEIQNSFMAAFGYYYAEVVTTVEFLNHQ